MSPHKVHLNLRQGVFLILICLLKCIMLGEPVTFTLHVQPARNYPLDVYLLMDLSYSMRDDLSNLQSLIHNISGVN